MGAKRWAPGSAVEVERGGSGEVAGAEGRSGRRLLRRAARGGEGRGERKRRGGLHWAGDEAECCVFCGGEGSDEADKKQLETDYPFISIGPVELCGLVMLHMCGLLVV